MARLDPYEIWRELDATDFDFVRRKHAMGGYGTKQKIVGQWLGHRERERTNRRADLSMWATIGGIAAAIFFGAAGLLR